MNSTTQAQKGFKTFILTLVVSLLVFSALYVVINEDPSAETLGVEEKASSEEQMQGSVFEELVSQKTEVETRTVLAGADDTSGTTTPDGDTVPESTVPDTGVVAGCNDHRPAGFLCRDAVAYHRRWRSFST